MNPCQLVGIQFPFRILDGNRQVGGSDMNCSRAAIAGSTVAGFPFLASIISIFAGAQLFALGIIGEYLARMHFRSMERPTYVVRADSVGEVSSAGDADS